MFKLIKSLLSNYTLLSQVVLLKKRIIFRTILLLSLLISIPTTIKSINEFIQLNHEVTLLTNHLPDYNTIKNPSENNAIKTDLIYFFNAKESLTDYEKSKLLSENDYLFLIENNRISFNIFAQPIVQNHLNQLPTLSQLKNWIIDVPQIPFLTILVSNIVFDFINNIFVIIVNNLFFAVITYYYFIIRGKKLRFDYLQRSTLFLSFLPYSALTILNLLNIISPYYLLFISIYIIYAQHQVIKVLIPSK